MLKMTLTLHFFTKNFWVCLLVCSSSGIACLHFYDFGADYPMVAAGL